MYCNVLFELCVWQWRVDSCLCVCVLMCSAALLRAGEQEWLSKALLDSEKNHIIIKSYKDHRKAIMAGAKLPEKWPLLEIKATFIKQSSTDVRAEGELMNRRRFIAWVSDRFCLF